MVSDGGHHHALVSMSFIPSPQGDRGPGAVILMRGAPTVRRREMLTACGCPSVRQGQRASFHRQTRCRHSPGPVFQEGFGTWEKWCICGTLCGIGRCYHRTQCEGFWCQLFHYPPRDASQLHALTLAHCSSLQKAGLGLAWAVDA